MRKNLARIGSILMVLVLCLSMAMPATAAASDYTISSNGLLSAYNGNDFYLTIPREARVIQGGTSSEGGAFRNKTSISSVTIPEGVTEIEPYAFAGCTDLTTVILPKSLKTIGEGAFSGCSKLTTVKVNWDSPNDLPTVATNAFPTVTDATLYVPRYGTAQAAINGSEDWVSGKFTLADYAAPALDSEGATGTDFPSVLHPEDVNQHTYVAYQIFSGTQSEDGTLGNIMKGVDLNVGDCGQGGLIDALYDDATFGVMSDNIFEYQLTRIDPTVFNTQELLNQEACRIIAETISEWGNNSEYAKAFARDALKAVSGGTVLASDGSPADGSKLDPGYYLVVDTYDGEDEGEYVKNPALLQVTDEGKVDIIPKVDMPTIEKKVLDINDTKSLSRITGIELTAEELEACGNDEDAIEIKKWENWFKTKDSEKVGADTTKPVGDEQDGWKDSADYDIGDHVPFLITYKLGRISSYPQYLISIDDFTYDKSFTYDENAVIKVDGAVLDPNVLRFSENNEEYEGQMSINWWVRFDPKEKTIIHDYSVITVEFTATLNSNAKIGSVGNENMVFGSYYPNPDNVNSEEFFGGTTAIASTAIDIVRVFTYKAEVNKVETVNGVSRPLAGAKFELFKKQRLTAGDGQTEGTDWAWVSLGNKEPTEVTDSNETVTSYSFDWVGIDDGDYKLVETQTPGGYNTGDDLYFTVSAGHTTLSDAPALESFTVDTEGYSEQDEPFMIDNTGTYINDIWDAEEGWVIDNEGPEVCAKFYANIENNKGSTLPETGGIGTKLFYVTGGILLCAAAVLLVTKKRFDNGAEA